VCAFEFAFQSVLRTSQHVFAAGKLEGNILGVTLFGIREFDSKQKCVKKSRIISKVLSFVFAQQ